jgi:dTDP-4-dehydrorhamnose reductase
VTVARTSLILTLGGEDGDDGKGLRLVAEALRGLHSSDERGPFVLFTDELRSMSFGDDLGRALVALASGRGRGVGIVHLAADEVATRWELAVRLARRSGLGDAAGVTVVPGLSSESGMGRPLNCALNVELLGKLLDGSGARIRGLSERLA